jgi:hypothetical protein
MDVLAAPTRERRSFSTNCDSGFFYEESIAPTSMSDQVVVLIAARTVLL